MTLIDDIEKGNALLMSGDAAGAVALFRRVIENDGDNAEALIGLANALFREGRDDAAWQCLERVCHQAADVGLALCGLARKAVDRGRIDYARNLVERALAMNPNAASHHFALARVLFVQSIVDEGEKVFARSIQLDSSYANRRSILADDATRRGDHQLAARHYYVIAQQRRDDAAVWTALGRALLQANSLEPARAALERARILASDKATSCRLLNTVLVKLRASRTERIPIVEDIVAAAPDDVESRMLLVRLLVGEHRYREAKQYLGSVLQTDAWNLSARWLDFQCPDDEVFPDEAARKAHLQRWHDGIAFFEKIDWTDVRATAGADAVLGATTNFYLAYFGMPLVEEQKRNARVLRNIVAVASGFVEELPIRRIGKKQRKVAIFSPSLREHSVEKVWAGVLQRLDSEEFELHVFCPGPEFGTGANGWRKRGIPFETGEHSAGEWISRLKQFTPDILIYVDIGMDQFVQSLAVLRLAPVQLTTWAHPVTSGMSTIDYFLSADAFEPTDADTHYSETLVRLPALGVYLEPPAISAERAPRRGDRGIRFVCTQSLPKLHPAHDELFAKILHAAPFSELHLFTHAKAHNAAALEARLKIAFEKANIDFAARCRVYAELPLESYHEQLVQADVWLDTLDFSGCLTSIDALWIDLPMVTKSGTLMRGRQTSGLLRSIGLNDVIAESSEEYVRIAARLASDAAYRDDVVRRMRARKHELFHNESAVTALGRFLRDVEHPSLRG